QFGLRLDPILEVRPVRPATLHPFLVGAHGDLLVWNLHGHRRRRARRLGPSGGCDSGHASYLLEMDLVREPNSVPLWGTSNESYSTKSTRGPQAVFPPGFWFASTGPSRYFPLPCLKERDRWGLTGSPRMRKTKGEQFAGVTVALITPFRDGEVDYEALNRLVDWHVEQGTDCLAPVGTTGESPTLSHD